MSEEMWFPEFGLKINPFVHADKETEIGSAGRYKTVETDATKMVKRLIESRGSRAIIYGPKGCGKSTTLYAMRDSAIKYRESDDSYVEIFPIVISSRSLQSLVKILLEWGLERMGKKEMEHLNNGCSAKLQGCIVPFTPPKKQVPSKCVCYFNPPCPQGHKCDFPLFSDGITFDKVMKHVQCDGICTLAEWAVVEIFAVLKVNIFLFDVPGEVGHEAPATYFKNFMLNLCARVYDPTVILMATNEQYSALLKTEFFPKWFKRQFPPMKEVELRRIYANRLREAMGSRIKFQNPIQMKALNYIILKTGNNPRNMIMAVNFILDKMREEGKMEPADADYVQEKLESVGGIVSEEEALKEIIEEFRATGVRKVGSKEILKRWREKDAGIRLNEKNVGWMMRRLGFKRLNGPFAVYQIQ
jgi:hypothetical protein